MFWLFSRHPEQWTILRERTELASQAVSESLRLESSVQAVNRRTKGDIAIDGWMIPKESPVVLLLSSAGRDERKYLDPEKFDVLRSSSGNVAFGHGNHTCAGMNMAKLEMTSLLRAFLSRVSKIEVVHAERLKGTSLRGFKSLVVRVE
jgi:cytochrome P450